MKYLPILWALIGVTLVYLVLQSNHNEFYYRRGFEEMRGKLESFHRTTGRGIDPAFICREK